MHGSCRTMLSLCHLGQKSAWKLSLMEGRGSMRCALSQQPCPRSAQTLLAFQRHPWTALIVRTLVTQLYFHTRIMASISQRSVVLCFAAVDSVASRVNHHPYHDTVALSGPTHILVFQPVGVTTILFIFWKSLVKHSACTLCLLPCPHVHCHLASM